MFGRMTGKIRRGDVTPVEVKPQRLPLYMHSAARKPFDADKVKFTTPPMQKYELLSPFHKEKQ